MAIDNNPYANNESKINSNSVYTNTNSNSRNAKEISTMDPLLGDVEEWYQRLMRFKAN